MRFGSVCSGIEAASVAFNPLGWEAAWFSEIEPFPCSVLTHHYPTIPNLGDMTTISSRIAAGEVEAPDLLCGGTPCQAFSVAGLRNSLKDARGNLSLIFCEIANQMDASRSVLGQEPAIIFWENVPGVLSTKDNAFGCFLAGLAGEDDPVTCANNKWATAGVVVGQKRTVAWRVLDAQYFGVAQRRRRVFVVASAREGFDPIEVLFEYKGLRRDSAPFDSLLSSCEVGDITEKDADGVGIWWDGRRVSQTLDAVLYKKQALPEKNRFPAVLAPAWQKCECCDDFICNIHHGEHVHDCDCPSIDHWSEHDIFPYDPCVLRFITPVECERLQGFEDDYTLVPHRNKPAADGPRYKALGNTWAVPVVRWIGKCIDAACKSGAKV
jgi:DNA (cytosine-5)-methyltransferase 1